MTKSLEERRQQRAKRRARLGSCVFVMFATVGALGMLGFRVNFTPSEPMGLWQIFPLDRPLRTGDLVFICPPVTDAMREARSRGYLRHGLCPGGIAPLIKMVAAVPGQTVDIGDDVRIDGKQLAHSRLMARDGQGRSIAPSRGGVVPPGTVYLHSDFVASFDSRYFGPLPLANILGLAREVWTYGP
jgi:conjugative transfer signal peptidase TraF